MAYFHCLIGGGSSGGGYELTVTCDADFAGTTITCTDGVTTLTQTCPSSSPYNVVFAIPNGGEWTISGIISGQTYSASIDIPDSLELNSVPEGSTVLPTDDIQTWLACAGIKDKSYTTLNEVLADSTTLLALMSNNNAVDYLVRSTTWASGITADSTAMTDIGANNYCANTLLSDSTWVSAIANSTYFESVLNVKVPTMTSNTTPNGECFGSGANSTTSNYQFYHAFCGNNTKFWANDNNRYGWIAYDFVASVKCYKFRFNPLTGGAAQSITFNVQATNDKTGVWTDVCNSQTVRTSTAVRYNGECSVNAEAILSPDQTYRYYRYIQSDSTYGPYTNGGAMQFYGRADV